MSMFTIAGAPTIEEGDMELIFSTTLTSSAASIATGTLPTGYKSLRINTSLRTDGNYHSASVLGYLNGDFNSANYVSNTALFANTTSLFAVNEPGMSGTNGASAPAGRFNLDTIVILDHESTVKYKSWATRATVHNGTTVGGRIIAAVAGQWLNTDAITSITFTAAGTAANFVSGSSVAVYGLK